MQEALQLLSELTDDDICWLQNKGHEQQTIAGTLLIREGEHPDAGVNLFAECIKSE